MIDRKVICDICSSKEEVSESVEIQVIFTTDQEEGKYTELYLSDETFDICKKCLLRRLEGESIYGNGAQGFNNYYFKERKSK